MKKIIFIALLILSSFTSFSQNQNEKFEECLTYVKSNNLNKAESCFQSLLETDRKNKDIIFNLAYVKLNLNKREEAIVLLQKAVQLNDREAAKVLTQELHEKIAYYDTMLVDYVDEKPLVINGDKREDIIVKSGRLNPVLEKQIMQQFKKTRINPKNFKGGRLFLQLFIEKDGSLNCIAYNVTAAEQVVLTEGFKKIILVPGKHEGKAVIVRGWNLPIS
ncbi:tetratricopeptide repeat protein [Dyadobacter frigoris]|uniref:Tetratricopeptide repeat protein n=1 Tax=Dyadobacter frigoris TaxID=2576211 RepID=A0A4U6DAW6_9BACT|nr:tetratricopeptide repeat protein [Dyadobacter frigoris]TKT93467.1 tetratricopeptide repeat protein [Dyadobacter frigoris]GLU55808.1 hypothetical protein Dfri01_52690 [Dyadobacter frigoris]